MSLSEKVLQLNQEIGSAVERALSDLRREASQAVDTLRASADEAVRRLESFTPAIPAAFLRQEDLAPAVDSEVRSAVSSAVEEAARSASSRSVPRTRREAFAELRDALSGVDRARSQAEILNALLQGSSRFASRAAVFLLRGNEVRGWGSQGFGDAEAGVKQLAFQAPADGGWARLAQGAGGVRLSAAETADLGNRLEAPVAHRAVLVPLVLRDHTAAALYADQLDGGELGAEALQTLTYVAALAIESLPFRERAATPTLQIEPAPEGDEAEEAASAPAATAAIPVAAPAPAAEEPAAEEPAVEPEPAPAWPVPVQEEEAPARTEAAYAAPVEAPVEEDTEVQLEETWTVEPEEELPSLDIEPPVEEAPPAPIVPITAEPEPAPAWSEPEPAPAWSEPAPAFEALPSIPETPAAPVVYEEPAAPSFPTQDLSLREVPSFDAAPAPAPPAAAAQETVILPRFGGAETPAPAPAPLRPVAAPDPEPAPAAAGGAASYDALRTTPLGGGTPAGSPEVRPPSDVQGPGWAFATTRVPVSPNEESIHEEARRLARLLVSEIKLYNEEQVDEGRRNRDLYERLKEDIDRSRQMYEERVEPRILKSTDYFYQELVRILAAGDSKALGI